MERVPVWMMRQAGRHMQVYRDLVKTYPTFRERSVTPPVRLFPFSLPIVMPSRPDLIRMACARALALLSPPTVAQEIPEVSFEISLQPWRAYRTDGVILFSDILTPLPGMNVDFDISESKGPIVTPYRTQERVDSITRM